MMLKRVEMYLTTQYITIYLGFFIAPVTWTVTFLNSILETETPALEGIQGDQVESEHLSGGVRQQMVLDCYVHVIMEQ